VIYEVLIPRIHPHEYDWGGSNCRVNGALHPMATLMKEAVSVEERGASSNGAISDSGKKTSCLCTWLAGTSDVENLQSRTTKFHKTKQNKTKQNDP